MLPLSERTLLAESLKPLRQAGQKIVFVSGNFNILHPGHLRFLRFAREQGGLLVVGLLDHACSDGAYLSNEERKLALESLEAVSQVVIVHEDLQDWILEIRPDIVVKGSEWLRRDNPELPWIDSYGGKLIFSAGEQQFASIELIQRKLRSTKLYNVQRPLHYLKRHGIESDVIRGLVSSFSRLKVAVLGDIIVDEYVECDPVGMSREDPTLVVTPIKLNRFLGGGGIVAGHARGLGASVDFYSVCGADSAGEFARAELDKQNIRAFLFVDESRPTTVKKRYRAESKTLLRVNDYRKHEIDSSIQEAILQAYGQHLSGYDLVIFSDFNYGYLCRSLVTELTRLTRQQGVNMVADSQSSSQTGDLAKFNHLLLATPTEYEARITISNTKDNLVLVSEALGTQLDAEHLLVTLGSEGVLIRSRMSDGSWSIDELPALNLNPVDPAGTGDALLTSSSMGLQVGASIWEAAYIGSVAAACQVGRIGNIPLQLEELLDRL